MLFRSRVLFRSGGKRGSKGGRITEAREVILLVKTTEKLEDKVYKTIKELHNYEIPEISTIQTSNVDKDYENWLKDFVEE